MYKKLLIVSSAVSLLGLSACGGINHSRVNEKQHAPADIKISHLDLANKNLHLRFEYRSYIKKKLDKIDCEIMLNTETSFKISQVPEIQLDAFSKEILKFSDVQIENINHIEKSEPLNYSLSCLLDYDKGSEYVNEKSALHLVPGSEFNYR